MRNILLLLFAVASFNLQAQINVIQVQEKEKPKEIIQPYDSLMSLKTHNPIEHIGQTLFLRGNPTAKDDGGFWQTFYTKPSLDTYEAREYIYKPIKTKESGKNDIITDYDSVIGKYYLVTNATITEDKYKMKYCCMELKEKESGDIMYYIFEIMKNGLGDFQTNIFLTLGYYEKMKKTYVGQEFYANGYDFRNIDSEKYFDIPFKTKFKCVDVGVSTGEISSFYAIMENPKYGKVRGVFEEDQINKIRNFVPISEYNLCIKRYGSYYGPLVMKKQVTLGMTRSMVREIKGNAKKVNYTEGSYGLHEQWVYGGGTYIYFENDRVTNIQN